VASLDGLVFVDVDGQWRRDGLQGATCSAVGSWRLGLADGCDEMALGRCE
jgi:hypothetical protein